MAQTISLGYGTALLQEVRVPRAYITNLNTLEILTDDNQIVDFKIYSQLQREANIFGNTVARYIEVNLLNPGNANYTSWLDHTLEVYVGLEVAGTPEYINQGRFRILNIEYDYNKETVKIQAYDRMIRFNMAYDALPLTYPISLFDFATELCVAMGLELGSVSFPNSTYLITEAPNVADGEFTYRNLLGWIAELAGGNAMIGRDGKVYITSYGTLSAYTIEPDEYYDLKIDTMFGPINSVRMIRSGVEDIVEYPEPLPANFISFDIIDNHVGYNQREDIIDNIYAVVNGLTYAPFNMRWRGTAHLDFGDRITLKDINNNTYVSYIMNHTLTFDGGMFEEINAIAYTASAQTFKSKGELRNRTIYTEARVDKVEGQISLLVASDEQLSTDYAQLLIDVGAISSTVQEVIGDVDTISSNLTQTAADLTLTFNSLEELKSYYQFTANSLTMGRSDSPARIEIGIVGTVPFMKLVSGTNETATITSDTMTITNAVITNSLQTGKHKVEKLSVGGTEYTVFLPN